MKSNSHRKAFTLVELLLVVAIISVLAAMVISNFANASQDTRAVVARQQLAVVQEAVNHWVNREIGRVTTAGGTGKTVNQVMSSYNAATFTSTPSRYELFKTYLDDSTQTTFTVDASSGRITSQAMRDVGMYLTLPNWAASSYPKVQLLP